MNDLGEERKMYMPSEPADKPNQKVEVVYPRESFTTDQIPELASVKLGDKVALMIQAEVVSIRAGEEYIDMGEDKKNQVRVTLELKQGQAKVSEAPKVNNKEADNTDIQGIKDLKAGSAMMDWGVPGAPDATTSENDDNED